VDIMLPLSHITKSVLYVIGGMWWWANLPSFDIPPAPYRMLLSIIPYGFYMLAVGIFEFIVGVMIILPNRKCWWGAYVISIVSIVGVSIMVLAISPLSFVLFVIPPNIWQIFVPIIVVGMACVNAPFAIIIFVIMLLEIIILRDERIKRRYKIIE